MVVVEIPENANCPQLDMRVFHDLDAARSVHKVRLERHAGEYAWYEVVGWTQMHKPCPAYVNKVDDSGDGVAFLVYGGEFGLRLRPEGQQTDWKLEDADQWGESLLILGDESDVVCRG